MSDGADLPGGPASADVRGEEQRVEQKSAVFRKELGLTDLVLTQIVFVVGTIWVGTAAKLGNDQLFFWLLAIVTFYLPLAAVVIHLNRLMPLEGGLYQWAKLGFNEFTGFMVAWNLWLFAILNTSEIGLQASTSLAYALGPRFGWVAGAKWFIALMDLLIIGLLVGVSMLGLGIGKWVSKAGGLIMLITFGVLVLLPVLNYTRGTITEYHPLRTAMPTMSLLSFNIFAKLGFGALGGLEYVAIHAVSVATPRGQSGD